MNNVKMPSCFIRKDAIMTIIPKKPVPPPASPSSYEETVEYGKIEACYKETLRGPRRYKKEAVNYDMCRERNNIALWRELKSGNYVPGPYHKTVIYEPKERVVSIPKLRDKIVQLVVHRELQNIYRPVFVERSFACQFGKGSIRAAFNVQHDMRVAQWKHGKGVHIVKIDVKKFFYSIDRDILKQLLRKKVKDEKFFSLLCKVIDSSPEGEKGIPLGNVSSQDFANVVLNEVDQYCIRYLKIKHYTRYMDDIVIVAPDIATAREWLEKVVAFLEERLHLKTNDKTKIFPIKQGVNAYGFKIKTTHMLLRDQSKRAAKRRIKRMDEKIKAGLMKQKEVIQAVQSWLGFARWACAFNLCKKIFASCPYIKVEGEMYFGNISRNRQTRRFLQQRDGSCPTY